MNESLADIEALSLRCSSEESKDYISEATLCYRVGAYRAAIVSTWIAVVFDLIDKIRELSLAGDHAARELEDKFQKYIDQINEGNRQGITKGLEFEREILTTCREKLQFFDQQQLQDLNRLREDRHRCAHPSFQQVGAPYKPSAEQARLHIRNAVVHVLAQPPVQGKAAIASIKKCVASDYFPEEMASTILQLKKWVLISRQRHFSMPLLMLLFSVFSIQRAAFMRRSRSYPPSMQCMSYSRVHLRRGSVYK